MDTEYLNDPEQFPKYTDDPVALDMIQTLGKVIFDKRSDPGVGFAVYRVQHDGWRITGNKNEEQRWLDQKFAKGKRASQIKRAMNILCQHNHLARWEWVNAHNKVDEPPVFHIVPGVKWGDIQQEQEKRERDRANRAAVSRMHEIQKCREKVRRARAEVHRAKQKLLLEDVPALVEYLKSVDPDESQPPRGRGWDTPEATVRSTVQDMERAMYERISQEQWMQRVMQEQD